MQGQRGATGSLPDPINLDFRSTSSNVAVDQQICWNHLRDPTESRLAAEYVEPVSQEARNLTRWSIGESSSSNSQNLINHDDRMAQNGWSSSIMPPRQQIGQLYEPSMVTSRNAVNLNLNINQIPNGPFASYDSNGDPMDCSNSFKPSGLEHRLFPSSSGSEPPFDSSSGTRGFLVEDDGVRLDSRRLSCKRKTIEGNVGQSSNSTTSFFSRESSMWQAVPPSLNIPPQLESSAGVNIPDSVNSRLELSMLGFAPDTLHTSSVASAIESSQRSYRLRMNPSNHQDSLSNNSYLPRATAGHSNVPPGHQPLRLVPINPPPEVVPPRVHFENAQLPGLRRNNHSVRLGGTSSRSRAATTGERDAPLYEDLNSRPMPRNISEQPMFTPSSEVRNNVAHNPPPNWNLNGGGGVVSRHVGSSSRAGAGSSSNSISGGPSWGSSRRHPSSQYSRRLSEYVRRSLLSSAGSEIGGSSSSAHRSVPSSSLDVGLPSGGGGHHGHNHPFSRSAQWMDRHGDGGIGIPYSLRALSAAGEGRSRLVSEQIRNVLDMMRRGEGLRLEDVMILDPSVLFGMADIHDQHRDMRLDVDNMSYEELLALEERIGSVCTGLSAETVAARMKQRKYFAITRNDQAEVEPCCICQEEYNNGDDLGTLDCGHDFHTECIKQWLGQKNMCPICKTAALAA